MAVMLRHPTREMGHRIPRRFTDMMDEFLNEALNVRNPEAQGFVPAADIYEDEKYFYLNLYIPGLSKNDVTLSIDGNILRISGERKWFADSNENEDKWNLHLVEGNYGQFERSFALPRGIDTENIEATCENGVLQVQIMKADEHTGKQIEIK